MSEEDEENEQAGREQLSQISVPRWSRKPASSFWSDVVLKIIIMQGIWPALSQLYISYGELTFSSFSFFIVLEMLFFFVVMLFLGMCISLLFVSFLCAAIELVMRAIFRTLQLDSEKLWVGNLVGGLVGLLASAPIFLSSSEPWHVCFFAISTATVLGQLGGTWGAWISLSARNMSAESVPNTSRKLRFGTRQLFIITTWCALVLTVLSLLNMFSARLFVVILIWTVFQVVGLVVTEVMRRRSLRRSSLSTTSSETRNDEALNSNSQGPIR